MKSKKTKKKSKSKRTVHQEILNRFLFELPAAEKSSAMDDRKFLRSGRPSNEPPAFNIIGVSSLPAKRGLEIWHDGKKSEREIRKALSQIFPGIKIKLIAIGQFKSKQGRMGNPIRNEYDPASFGTLGGYFRHQFSDDIFGLSNNHAIGRTNLAQYGDPIVCMADGHRIGEFFTLEPLVDPPGYNQIDAATFRPYRGTYNPDEVESYRIRRAQNGDVVFRIDANGIPVSGTIHDINFNAQVSFTAGTFNFINAIRIASNSSNCPFAPDGTSGSLVFNKNGALTGLLFAGSADDQIGLACHIDPVMDALHLI